MSDDPTVLQRPNPLPINANQEDIVAAINYLLANHDRHEHVLLNALAALNSMKTLLESQQRAIDEFSKVLNDRRD